VNGLFRASELGDQFRARYAALRKLGIPVAHVARSADAIADEVLEISRDVQRERGAGVRDAGRRGERAFIVRVRFDLTREGVELALEKDADCFDWKGNAENLRVITSEARDLAFRVTAKSEIPRFARDDRRSTRADG